MLIRRAQAHEPGTFEFNTNENSFTMAHIALLTVPLLSNKFITMTGVTCDNYTSTRLAICSHSLPKVWGIHYGNDWSSDILCNILQDRTSAIHTRVLLTTMHFPMNVWLVQQHPTPLRMSLHQPPACVYRHPNLHVQRTFAHCQQSSIRVRQLVHQHAHALRDSLQLLNQPLAHSLPTDRFLLLRLFSSPDCQPTVQLDQHLTVTLAALRKMHDMQAIIGDC